MLEESILIVSVGKLMLISTWKYKKDCMNPPSLEELLIHHYQCTKMILFCCMLFWEGIVPI